MFSIKSISFIFSYEFIVFSLFCFLLFHGNICLVDLFTDLVELVPNIIMKIAELTLIDGVDSGSSPVMYSFNYFRQVGITTGDYFCHIFS